MPHLRTVCECIEVFDDQLQGARPIDGDPDALLQRGLVHVEGDVYDCCRRRDHARDGTLLCGDLRVGRRVRSRFDRMRRTNR